MKVYQLTVSGLNSDRPLGCLYFRGSETMLATPFGDEPLEWLARQSKKNIEEILVEKHVTREVMAFYIELLRRRNKVYKTAKQLFETETQLAIVDSIGYANEYEQIKKEIDSLKEKLNFQKKDANFISKEILTRHTPSINFANLKENLHLSVPYNVSSGKNKIKLLLDIVPSTDKQLEDLLHGIYKDEPFYEKDGVNVSYFALTKVLNQKIRLHLQVKLPKGVEPLLADHLQPMKDAIENYIVEQGFVVQ